MAEAGYAVGQPGAKQSQIPVDERRSPPRSVRVDQQARREVNAGTDTGREARMRIKSVGLRNYKRFTELTIAGLPATARLVVLVGPNGTGKSSVFDSFLLKAGAAVDNYGLSGDRGEYYDKKEEAQSRNSHEVARRVTIEFHGLSDGEVDLKSAFQARSGGQNEIRLPLSSICALARSRRMTGTTASAWGVNDVDASVMP